MSKRPLYWLGGLTGIGLACGFAGAIDHRTLQGTVLVAIAARILAIALVGGLVGIFVGNTCRVLASAAIGVLLADLAWLGFVLWTFSIGPEDAVEVVSNPIAVLALIACPAAASNSRAWALCIGISLSLIVPATIAGLTLIWSSTSAAPGTGLTQALAVIVAAIAIATGVIGTIAARAVFEVVGHYAFFREAQGAKDGAN